MIVAKISATKCPFEVHLASIRRCTFPLRFVSLERGLLDERYGYGMGLQGKRFI